MIVHSDSALGFFLAFLWTLTAIIALFAGVVLAVNHKFRSAAKVAGATLGAMVGWVLVVTAISFAAPQTIVNVGDSYCVDIRCIGIDKVRAEPQGGQTIYNLDVHLFSDANTVKVSFGAVSLVLVDERGRRFPMIPSSENPPPPPYDTYLDPGQTIKTTLTFAVASDAKQLFLIDTPRTAPEGAKPGSIGGKHTPSWAPYFGLWFNLASLGNDRYPLHKPTLMRVL